MKKAVLWISLVLVLLFVMGRPGVAPLKYAQSGNPVGQSLVAESSWIERIEEHGTTVKNPDGTFTYTTEGPELEWEFEGRGFVPPNRIAGTYHHYVLVYYADPWPGTNLVCLAGSGDPFISEPWIGVPFTGDSLSLSGSHDFGMNINDGKIWIVRRDWVDCTGYDQQDPPWTNLDRVPRLTNDRNEDGEADATETRRDCPSCDYGEGVLAYDWLFETALINYHDTDGPGS